MVGVGHIFHTPGNTSHNQGWGLGFDEALGAGFDFFFWGGGVDLRGVTGLLGNRKDWVSEVCHETALWLSCEMCKVTFHLALTLVGVAMRVVYTGRPGVGGHTAACI